MGLSAGSPPPRTASVIDAPIRATPGGAGTGQALQTGEPSHAQRHGNVLGDRQMRIERVGLEHHGDVAPVGCQAVHRQAVDGDWCGTLRLEPGDDAPQQRRLTAARWPQDGDEFAGGTSRSMSLSTETSPNWAIAASAMAPRRPAAPCRSRSGSMCM